MRAIGVSHTACKDEFRRNLWSHSWSVFSFFITYICINSSNSRLTSLKYFYKILFYQKNSRTSAVSSTSFRSILIFASCVVGTCNIQYRWVFIWRFVFLVHYNGKLSVGIIVTLLGRWRILMARYLLSSGMSFVLLYKKKLRTSAVSSTNFRSILIFASCVVGTCNILQVQYRWVFIWRFVFLVDYNGRCWHFYFEWGILS